MNETMPDEMMYSAEKSPIIANEREVTLDSKDKKKRPELTFVLSVNNYLRICGNHISGFYGRLKIAFFGLEFNIPGVKFWAFATISTAFRVIMAIEN